MMDLHSRISKSELAKEPHRFSDFLNGVDHKKILRIDEVHPSDDNDTHYIFLIWVNPDEDSRIRKQIRKNARQNSAVGQNWYIELLSGTGDGLIMVSTWL